MPRVVVVGSINVDLTFRVQRLPQPGETLAGRAFDVGHGGKGANQAVMAARLGAEVALLGAVGDDAFGAQALENLRHQGVDTSQVRVRPGPTGAAVILVDDGAENAIVVVAGANGTLSAGDVRAARDVIAKADVVVAQLETPVGATREAFTLARAAGVKTALNPAPVVPGVADLLPLCDLCVPNETELAALTALPVYPSGNIGPVLDALLALGPAAVLVTLGSRGSQYQDRNGSRRVEALTVTAVDPTAAGDAYIGSLAVDLAGGLPIAEAMRRAGAAAALTVTRPGAQRSFPSKEELEAFLAPR
ncbi:MAG: ribokinase [Gemmataceae bacterium]